MKSKLTYVLVWVAAAIGTCASPVRVTVQTRVVDMYDKPVPGATVHLSLPRYGLGRQAQSSQAITNTHGIALLSGYAEQDYSVSVEKTGYYYTRGPHRAIDTEKSMKQFGLGIQNIELQLRPILNPVQGVVKSCDRMRIPVTEKPVGFDVVAGDWVQPFGKGVMPDFVFLLSGRFDGINDFDQTLTLTFGRANDGIMLFQFTREIGPTFKYPYEAEMTGYNACRIWTSKFDGNYRVTNVDQSGKTNYIWRVRSEVDSYGNVSSGLYGVIGGDIVLGGNNETGRNVSFSYMYNPNRTRNLEFEEYRSVR